MTSHETVSYFSQSDRSRSESVVPLLGLLAVSSFSWSSWDWRLTPNMSVSFFGRTFFVVLELHTWSNDLWQQKNNNKQDQCIINMHVFWNFHCLVRCIFLWQDLVWFKDFYDRITLWKWNTMVPLIIRVFSSRFTGLAYPYVTTFRFLAWLYAMLKDPKDLQFLRTLLRFELESPLTWIPCQSNRCRYFLNHLTYPKHSLLELRRSKYEIRPFRSLSYLIWIFCLQMPHVIFHGQRITFPLFLLVFTSACLWHLSTLLSHLVSNSKKFRKNIYKY